MSRIRIEVPPPTPADYEVVVESGSLARLGSHVTEVASGHRYAIIADDTVAGLYGEAARQALASAGLRANLYTFPAGEAQKTRTTWASLTDRMLEDGLGRDAVVIGLGGGVACDVAGFVASTYMRGIPVVQVPTSLLAMVDASVGGKTGVDTRHGKNLVGAFHHPRRVVADPDVLRTLPDSELRCGLAEAVKHGAIVDASYLSWIESSAEALLAREPMVLTELVRRSVEIKAAIVVEDPLEAGARKALNFGHTIGHAIETIADYGLPHGYAVSIGMVAEAAAGESAGITAPGTAETLRRVLTRLGLPVDLPTDLPMERLIEVMMLDKKARQARAHFALLARVGVVARTPEGGWTHALERAHIRPASTSARA